MKQILEELDIVCLIRFGSHLYGTNTENSDTDYKGVFMPTKEMVCLGKIPKSIKYDTNPDSEGKNSRDDIDAEVYSLHYFIELACKGETVALDMLHVNEQNLIQGSGIWDSIVKDRQSFFTKNLKSFVGYARKQAAKYGVKGSRLNAASDFVDHIQNKDGRLSAVWDSLPINEHCFFLQDTDTGIKQYQICGKILQSTISMDMAHDIMSKFISVYGARAKQAAENKGVDWKAMSHAIRAAYQTKEILTNGCIQYPLEHAAFLTDVKTGKLDFLHEVLPVLESEMLDVEKLSAVSFYPDKVDRKRWNNFIINSVSEIHFKEKV